MMTNELLMNILLVVQYRLLHCVVIYRLNLGKK